MTPEDVGGDVARVVAIGLGLIPGVGVAAPLVAEAVSVIAPLIYRLARGESLASIEADPIKEAHGIDRAALRKALEDAL